MHQVIDDVRARFTFKPEDADQFLEDGQTVTEVQHISVEEVAQFVNEFQDSLLDVQVLIDGAKVVNLSDFTYDI